MKCGRQVKEHFGSKKYALFGQEAIGSTWALAKMNMFLHGEDNHRVEWGDTLRNPLLLEGITSSSTSTSLSLILPFPWTSGGMNPLKLIVLDASDVAFPQRLREITRSFCT
jgi:type I restriction-modification system DNA methylase subunit